MVRRTGSLNGSVKLLVNGDYSAVCFWILRGHPVETLVLDQLPSHFIGCNWSDKAFCVLEEEENRQGDEQDGRGGTPPRWSEEMLNFHSQCTDC